MTSPVRLNGGLMKEFIDIFTNYPVMCAFISWVAAQILKTVLWVIKNRKFNFLTLIGSGGMPSSHSSTVCALATAIGRTNGFESVEFALSFVLAFIVMYDAAGVRRATGEQAKILNRIVSDLQGGKTEDMPKRLKELVGHTPLQVFAGAVLGVMITVIVGVITSK